MPIEVEVPEVGIVEFPDDATESEISRALSSQFGGGTSAENEALRAEQRRAARTGAMAAFAGNVADVVGGSIEPIFGGPAAVIRQIEKGAIEAPLQLTGLVKPGEELALKPSALVGYKFPIAKIPEVKEPPIAETLPPFQKALAKAGVKILQPAAGLGNAAIDLAKFIASPEFLAYIGLGKAMQAASSIGKAGADTVAAYFAGTMLTQAPQEGLAALEAFKEGKVQEGFEKVGNFAAANLMGAAAGRHALEPVPTMKVPTPEEALQRQAARQAVVGTLPSRAVSPVVGGPREVQLMAPPEIPPPEGMVTGEIPEPMRFARAARQPQVVFLEPPTEVPKPTFAPVPAPVEPGALRREIFPWERFMLPQNLPPEATQFTIRPGEPPPEAPPGAPVPVPPPKPITPAGGLPVEKGPEYAEGIRSDTGRPAEEGKVPEGREADRGRDVEQAPPVQPEPVVAGEKGQATGEVLLKPPAEKAGAEVAPEPRPEVPPEAPPSPAKAKEPWEMTKAESTSLLQKRLQEANAEHERIFRKKEAEHKAGTYTGFGYSAYQDSAVEAAYKVRRKSERDLAKAEKEHEKVVKTALREGKPVPPEVLAEYGLKPKAETPPSKPTTPAGWAEVPRNRLSTIKVGDTVRMSFPNAEPVEATITARRPRSQTVEVDYQWKGETKKGVFNMATASKVERTAPTPAEKPGLIAGTAAEKWADERIKEQTKRTSALGLIDPEFLAAAAIKGAAFIERGIRDFAAWSKEMKKLYGPVIEKHLTDIYVAATQRLKEAGGEAAPTPAPAEKPAPAAAVGTRQPVIPETPKVVSRARLAEGFETIPKGNEAREMAYSKDLVDRHGTNYENAWAEIRGIEDPRTKAIAEATLMARMAEGRKPGDPIDPLLVNLQERVGTAAKESWSAAGSRLQAQHPVIRIIEPYMAYYSWLGILRQKVANVVDPKFGPDTGQKIAEAYGTSGVDAATFRREFNKRVPLPNVGKADKVKLENALPEIMRLADMGLLDNEAFRRALGKEYGIEEMTGPTARKLMDLSTAYQKAPEGLQRDKVMLQMANTLADAADVKPWQLAQDYWYASVLFRAGTWLNVAVGSGLTAPFFTAGMAIDRMARLDPMGAMRILHQLLSGLGEGAIVGQQIARRGDYYLLHDFPARFRGVIEGTKKADSLEAILRKGGLAGNTIGRLAFTRRIMTALDYGFAIGGRNAALAYSLMTRGDKAGLKALSRKWDAEANRQASEQALRELGPGATRAELIVRRHQILEQGISEQSKEVASLIGQRVAQNAEPTGLGYYVYRMASALPFFLKAPAGLAFVRAGANMAANVADAYPLLGLGRAALGKIAETKISKLGEEGAAPWKHFLNTPEERRIQVALQGAGMAATGLLAGYFLGDDKDKAMDITGPWAGVSPMEAKVLRGKGERPLSIGFKRADGSTTWVSYRNTPLLPIFAAVGWVRDKQRFDAKKFEKMDAPSILMNAYLSGVMSIKDIASIGGIAALFNQQAGTIDEPANALNRAVGQAAGRFSAGFIPSLVSELDQYTDPNLYQPTKGEMLGYWLRNYPFVRKMVGQGPALDILGDPIAQTKPPLRQYLQSEHRNDKAWRVLNRAMEQGSFPTYAVDRQIVDEGVKRDMTEAEKYRYQKYFGKELRTAIEDNAETLLTFDRDQLNKWFHNTGYWEPRKALAARMAVTGK